MKYYINKEYKYSKNAFLFYKNSTLLKELMENWKNLTDTEKHFFIENLHIDELNEILNGINFEINKERQAIQDHINKRIIECQEIKKYDLIPNIKSIEPLNKDNRENHISNNIPISKKVQSKKEYNVAIICALYEEAIQAKIVFSNYQNTNFQEEHFGKEDYLFYKGKIKNLIQDEININIFYSVNKGFLDIASLINSIKLNFKNDLIIMTGICAGDKTKTNLGDIIIADKIFIYGSGSIEDTNNLKPETNFHSLKNSIKQNLDNIAGYKEEILRSIKTTKPISDEYRKSWFLCYYYYQKNGKNFESISQQSFDQIIGNRNKIIVEKLIKSGLILDNVKKIELSFDGEKFVNSINPGRNPNLIKEEQQTNIIINPIASVLNVFKDQVILEKIHNIDRKAISIDMEGFVFYKIMNEENTGKIKFLLVKGVSDYADSEKDDQFHDYAAQASASYALEYIKRETFRKKGKKSMKKA